ncbi:MAG: hypothetical protein SF053_06075 [Bacteroidia bacterium]|nr:hypothetical protein [Bacteroidia bacterium]
MKQVYCLLAIAVWVSCASPAANQSDDLPVDTRPHLAVRADEYVNQYPETIERNSRVYASEAAHDALMPQKEAASLNHISNEIPPDGKYRFDIAFAEWGGKSMGEKVTVIIHGNSIQVVYEGDGNLSLTTKGEILDEGTIMRHKTGSWIIGHHPSDAQLDEVGGCTGGPAIINFKTKQYWMC